MSSETSAQQETINTDSLKRLREPFPDTEISWKPKPTRAQTEEVKRDFKKGMRCQVCGGWHHPAVVHLAYVGHAATTKRLLEVDPAWNWEFHHVDERGLPIFDNNGGLWITLTVLGVTRKGYGDADGKSGPNAVKEIIGDAIRNAAMRFGVALELWHKGEFERDVDIGEPTAKAEPAQYPEDDFNRNFPKWEKSLQAGKISASDLIAKIESKGALTEEQKQQINNIQ